MLALVLVSAAPLPDATQELNASLAKFKPSHGGVLELKARDYGIGAPLDGTVPNVTLRGVRGATRLIKLDQPRGDGILSLNGGRTYTGWTFEGIEFQGRASDPSPGTYFTLFLSESRDVRFVRCTFRNLDWSAFCVRNSENIAFEDCDFYGTQPGVIQGGKQDPPANSKAQLLGGLRLGEQVRNIQVDRCRFHFCAAGINVSTQQFQSSSGLRVTDCEFRSDWWDNPYPTLRFRPAKAETRPGVGYVLTCKAGGLTRACTDWNVIAFRRPIAEGKGFSRLSIGEVGVDAGLLKPASLGDVIETVDGKRARITSIASPKSVWIERWESIDTYEPCGPPRSDVGWRLSRYYAITTQSKALSDTEVVIMSDPINPLTGERAQEGAKLDFTKFDARVLAKTGYSGVHINAAVRGVLVSGCTFRGTWADQCSFFNLPEGARILGNRFLYGQDMGVTCTVSPRSVIADNVFMGCGTGAIYLGASDRTTVRGNTIEDWGNVNNRVGGIDGNGKGLVIEGNSFGVSPARGRDWSRYAVRLNGGDCTGSVIAGNTDSGSTVATLRFEEAGVAPRKGAITIRDVEKMDGDRKATANTTNGK